MVQSLVALLVLVCCSFSSNAQTTGDLLDPSAQNWSGTYGTGYWGQGRCSSFNCTTGSTDPNRIPDNSGFIWSGGANIISTTIAINTALQQAGIQVNGFNYKWRVKNGNANLFGNQPGVDDFAITVDILDSNGNVYQTYTYDYGHSHNWTNHTGQELFPNNFLPPSYFSDINISAQGSDSANWPGWYGPEFNVRDSEFNLMFSANPCHGNALHDPQCPGYVTALFNQQCTQNPLYDPSCSGYAAAYLQQQCSANPLYDPACSGYTVAYYNQQCKLNPLYDSGCTGYKVAYLNQQCGLDPLYDPSCSGYAAAYLADRCYYDPLYDVQCTGYQQAYFDQQCELDSQYDQTCPNFNYVLIGDDDTDYNPIAEVLETPDYVTDEFVTVDAPMVEPVVPIDTYIQEPEVVTQEEIQQDYATQTLEDDIEAEIAILEAESAGGEINMDDNIEAELEQLENEAVEEEEIVLLENTIEECDPDEKDCAFEEEEVSENDIDETIEVVESKDGESGDGKTNQEDDIEKEIAALKAEAKEKKQVVKKESLTKNDKIRMLLAKKANELTKKMENLATLEQQMLVQRQLLALISFVPGFDYNDKDVLDLANFYPDKPTVDHQFSRWFLNDPNFGAMEDLQYPKGFD